MARKLLVVLLLLSGWWVSHAETYLVTPDGTGDFPTIQAAINSASDGDIILLADGVFLGAGNRDITFLGRTVTVQSKADDPSVCILDCQGSEGDPHRGFAFVSDETRESVLRGITIMNGRMDGWGFVEGSGGAILCEDASPTIEDCVFLHNTARSGGAVPWSAKRP
ncbi:MAG: hypothetical protein KAY32_03270 [Candidatus Eisenbacteria sp.]|nr:hypothetical protein [Candidatus Eisenbacteria bacterium]